MSGGGDDPPGLTYAGAGVDIGAGEEAVRRIARRVRATAGPEVLGGLGGFAGLFALDVARWRQPVLAAATDGVGTKAAVASQAGRYDTIGIDLVAMCVDDLVCVGAEPLFLLDYYATGRLEPTTAEAVVAGVAEGCRQAGCALIGGEMAEHPGAGPGDSGAFDLAGFAVGVVERDGLLGPERVQPGDVVVGLFSPGLRCNGYALGRQALLHHAGASLAGPAWPGAGHLLADELLAPSIIYAPGVMAAVREAPVRAAAHITGGGIATNLARALPSSCDAVLQRSTWPCPRIFSEIQHRGGVSGAEMARVFNLGLGLALVVAPDGTGAALAALAGQGLEAGVVGHVVPGAGQVRLEA